jgi:hypothetical protein
VETILERHVFRLTLLRATGDTIFSREYPFVPLPVTRQAVDSAMASMERNQLLRRSGKLKELMAAVRREIPKVRPPVVAALIGSDGRIWVGQQPDASGRPWLIFEPQRGNVVGSVTLPKQILIRAADASHVWGIERNEFDIESVVRYRLGPAN